MNRADIPRACSACGARLARDNQDSACTPCQKKVRKRSSPAPDVSYRFWASDQMRDALDSWHMGRVIAAYRAHPEHGRPLAQELVAGWLGITQAQLSRIENGPPLKDLDKLIHWARIIGIPASLLWFKLPDSRDNRARRRPEGACDHPTAELRERHNDPQDSIGALIGLLDDRISLPEDSSESGERTTGRDEPFPPTTATLILELILKLDDEHGGDALYPSLSRFVRKLARTANRNEPEKLSAFGQLAQMTGWLALDSNQHPAARRYLTAAVHAGHEADDPTLAASALAYLSLQETYRSRPASALALARTATEMDDGGLTPLTRTMLAARLARARAGLGQRNDCLRELERARKAYCNAGSQAEPVWLSYVDDIEVAAQEGACYLDLGMTSAAIVALTEALDRLTSREPHRLRDRMHYLARLAKCHLLDRDIEQACLVGAEGLALCQTVGSARVLDRLAELHAALEPFGSSKAAREFRERFAATSADRRRKATQEQGR